MFKTRYLWLLIALFLLLIPSSGSAEAQGKVSAAQGPAVTIIYDLYATDAYVTLADGTVTYNYGFVGGREGSAIWYLDENNALQGPVTVPAPTGGPITPAEQPFAGHAQFPGPIIYASKGDVVEIRLKNLGVTNPTAPNDPHSIHLHGLDVNAANDGVPETSVGAVPANSVNPGAGNVVVYMFSPSNIGTYFYHCHQEASIHVTMGMYGALVIYNRTDPAAQTGPGQGKGGNLWGWTYDKDYVLLLSDTDLGQHVSEQNSGDFNPVNYTPQYWFINGLSFPNTIHAGIGTFNWDDWIKAHPGYDPLITGSVTGYHVADVNGPSVRGDRVLLRLINMGFQTQPMHMHGFHAKVLGSDQRPWTWANPPGTPVGLGEEKNTITIGSGEEYDLLLNFNAQSLNGTYSAEVQSRYDPNNANLPQSNTQTGLPAIVDPSHDPETYVGGPVVGPIAGQNDSPVLPLVQGQYFPFHNHDDYKATNNGVYPGGMFTFILTTP